MDEQRNKQRLHLPLLVMAAAALAAGLWAGLLRLGVQMTSLGIIPPGAHGPLIIAGFLGTLISLERAVALRQGAQMLPAMDEANRRRNWPDSRLYYLVPFVSGLGALTILLNLPLAVPKLLFTASAAGFVILNAMLYRRQPDRASLSLTAGAVLYLSGAAFWLTGSFFAFIVPWWIGFLVFTIAGERLELSRVRRPPPAAQTVYDVILGVSVLSLIVSEINFDTGLHAMGVGLLLLSLWLLRYDIAGKTRKLPGLPGYIGTCLSTGFIWLAIGGLIWIFYGGRSIAGPIYDAILHVILIGFVMAMIFGHAPVILPAVSGRPIAYLKAFFLPLWLLHITLIMRLAGDLFDLPNLRTWGAVGNLVAIIFFLLVMAAGARRGSLARTHQLEIPGSDPGVHP